VPTFPLQIEFFCNAFFSEDVMSAVRSLVKSESVQQLSQIVK